MSIARWSMADTVAGVADSPPVENGTNRPLHRIGEVRKQQGITARTVARRMDVPMEQVRAQEDPDSDISLSDLYRWQQALGVPVADLLVDLDAPLSTPVLERARLLKMMKTIRFIRENAECDSVRRMAKMLVEQLLEIMPELAEVSPWHTVGQRRTLDEYGRIAERTYSDRLLVDAGA